MDEAKISAQELMHLAEVELPVVAQMGIEAVEVEPGAVTAKAGYRQEFSRPGGSVSAPVMMTLADFVMWGVVLSLVGPVHLAEATNLNINFLRSPSPGEIIARGSILKLGQKLVVGEVSLYSGEEEDLIAHVTCTYALPPDVKIDV